MAFHPAAPLPRTAAAHTRAHPAALTRRRPRVPAAVREARAPPARDDADTAAADAAAPLPPAAPRVASRRAVSRRAVLAASAAVALSALAPPPPKTDALTLAPTPINPYARRRRERAYKQYAKRLEETIESVAVADFKKVIETGGGGISVSYRIAGFAAFVASALSTAIVHPIDSIKTRIQARGTELADNTRGLFDDLYTGLASNVLKEAPNAAVYLGVYELIKNGLINLSVTSFFHDLPLITFLVAGALGDAIGSIVRVPAEIVNKRLQLGVNASWVDATKEAFFTKAGREGSVVAWNAVLLRDVPYGGLQIMMYEFGKQVLATHPHFLNGYFAHAGLMADVFMGALAGALAAMVTTPADVLVTRLSVQNPQSYLETKQYMGVVSTARRILQEDGIGGFFKGTLQRGIYYAPLIGLFFALYELNRGWLSNPETVFAQVMSVSHLFAADWHEALGHLAAIYQSIYPALTGLIWLVSEQVPLAFSFAAAGSKNIGL